MMDKQPIDTMGYKCETCGWATTNKFDLLEHVLKHENGKIDKDGKEITP